MSSLAFLDVKNVSKRKDGLLNASDGVYFCRLAVSVPYSLDSKLRKANVGKKILEQKGLGTYTETSRSAKSAQPDWDEKFEFPLDDLSTIIFLIVEIWEVKKFKDVYIGCANIPINNSFITAKSREMWYSVYQNLEVEDESAGEVLMKMKVSPKIKSIERVSLSKDSINEIPSFLFTSFWVPRFLKELSFVECNISVIPDEIVNLSNLTSINLSKNKIVVVPKKIGSLRLLAFLDLSSNLIVDIPKSLTQLSSLRNFNIIENPLSEKARTLLQSMPAICQVKMLHLEVHEFARLSGMHFESKLSDPSLSKSNNNNSNNNNNNNNNNADKTVNSNNNSSNNSSNSSSSNNVKPKIDLDFILKNIPNVPRSTLSLMYDNSLNEVISVYNKDDKNENSNNNNINNDNNMSDNNNVKESKNENENE